MWRLELEPGDEIGIDGDHEIERPAERLGEGVAARFQFFFAQRPRGLEPGVFASGEPIPAGRRQRRQPVSQSADESVDARRVRQAMSKAFR